MKSKLCENLDHGPWHFLHNAYVQEEGSGWLYAGMCPGDILKVGGTSKCPMCRIGTYDMKPELVAVRCCEKWRTDEMALLDKLGPPHRAKEWFSDGASRLEWILKNRFMTTVSETIQNLSHLVDEARNRV